MKQQKLLSAEGGPLDPEVVRLLLQLSPALMLPGGGLRSVGLWRRSWQLCVKAFSSRQEVARVQALDISVAGRPIALRAYYPEGEGNRERGRPALMWIHGGGFVAGDLYTAGAACRRLANVSGCVVIAVRYRLAPESRLEDGLADCAAAYEWLTENGERLGIEGERIAVGGDSAGGALAALVAQKYAQAATPPVAQVLIYPAIELAAKFPRPKAFLDRIFAELFVWLQIQIADAGLDDPENSPGHAARVSDLAPTIMITAGTDPLRADAIRYGERLAESGVPLRVHHFPGQFHGFISFDRVLRGAQTAFDLIGGDLRTIMAGGGLPGPVLTHNSVPGLSPWLWLRPAQRLKEATVVMLMIRDIFSRANLGKAATAVR